MCLCLQVLQRAKQPTPADDAGCSGERGSPPDCGDGGECRTGPHQRQTVPHGAGLSSQSEPQRPETHGHDGHLLLLLLILSLPLSSPISVVCQQSSLYHNAQCLD